MNIHISITKEEKVAIDRTTTGFKELWKTAKGYMATMSPETNQAEEPASDIIDNWDKRYIQVDKQQLGLYIELSPICSIIMIEFAKSLTDKFGLLLLNILQMLASCSSIVGTISCQLLEETARIRKVLYPADVNFHHETTMAGDSTPKTVLKFDNRQNVMIFDISAMSYNSAETLLGVSYILHDKLEVALHDFDGPIGFIEEGAIQLEFLKNVSREIEKHIGGSFDIEAANAARDLALLNMPWLINKK